MKTTLIFLFTLLMLGQLQAQSPDITKDEVRVLTDRLVTILNGKQFKGTLIVDNFVNNDGTTTELGVYLSNKVRTELINAPAVFEVIQRPTSLEAPRRRSIDLSDAADQIPRTNSYDDTSIKDNAVDVGVDVGVDLLEGFLNRSRNPRYKGVDAIVQGKIVAFQDRYTLTITVISKKKQRSLAAVDGRVTNTSGLAALDGSVLPNPQTRAPGANGGVSPSGGQGGSGNALQSFNRMHLNFELIKCMKSGSYLELHLRLYSDGKVTNISTRYNHGKIYSQDGGAEFVSSTIHLGDVMTNSWAEKQLQPNTPIDVVVTFQPNEQVDVINKFQLGIRAEGVGDFLVEMNDIIVGY